MILCRTQARNRNLYLLLKRVGYVSSDVKYIVKDSQKQPHIKYPTFLKIPNTRQALLLQRTWKLFCQMHVE